MAKALKVAAVVVGVAALAIVTGGAAVGLGIGLSTSIAGTGISAGALLLTSTALSTGAALLTKKPSVTAAQTDRLFANIDPRAFRKTPLGSTALPVDVRYEEWSGKDQEYCDWIVCHASCAIDGIDEIWFDTEKAWTPATGAIGKFAGYFTVLNIVLEGTPGNAFSFASGKWNGSARLTGCAYSRWRFKATGNGKKAESPFASGIPSRITVVGRGAKLYDPRRDSTVPGGSGPMRADDQSTWRFTADDGTVIGENLPLQILRVVLGWRIRNPVTGEMRLATGSGVPARRLRLASWIVAANLADERVNRSAGGTEPRYHGAAVVSEGDDPKTTLDMLSAGCCGRFRDTSGKLSFEIAHNDLASAATDDGLFDDDVVGPFTWDPDPGQEAAPNVVRGRYVDASANSLYQLIDYPEVRIPTANGRDIIFTLDLGAVESASQAQRVVRQGLQRKQYQRRFSAPFDIRAWKYEVGSLVPFTFAPLGFVRTLFRVEAQELGQGGVCNMTLSFEHPAIYAFDADDRAPVQAAAPIVYDSRNNPLILAIDEAATTAVWDNVADPNGTKPQDNADKTSENTAKDTAAVGGRLAAEITRLIDLNGVNVLTEILRGDVLAAFVDARTMLDGKPVGTVLTTLSTRVETQAESVAQTFDILGGKNAAGTGWIFRGGSVIASADGLRLTSLDSLEASVNGISADIVDVKEILFDQSGATLRSIDLLDLEGNITGKVNTLTGERSDYAIYANVFRIVNPNGGQPFTPFQIGEDGTVEMISVRVKTLAYEALVPLFGGANNKLDPTYGFQRMPGGLIRQWGKVRQRIVNEVALSVVFPIPFPTACVASGSHSYISVQSTSKDMWMHNLGEPSVNGATFATQAATRNAKEIDGYDWWAEGY